MKIAIQAADLDSKRIDGTRVYLLNMLRHFGNLDQNNDFFIYHKDKFNPELEPPKFPNYKIKEIKCPFYWTQTRFAWEMLTKNYDRLWMPMQALPFLKKKKLISTVTIHDLAFKYFPQYFPQKDLRRLNLFTGVAIKKSDKIIAVSESTKKDILKFYPEIKEEKIKVIHHGFDADLFQKEIPKSNLSLPSLILPSGRGGGLLDSEFGIHNSKFILYVGALQPRKNLETLINAFELVKSNLCHSALDAESSDKNNLLDSRFRGNDIKLVLAGGKAWMWENIFNRAESSQYKKDIIITGTINFEEIAMLYKNASVFVFPSLYEGFGIPILEAQASGVPVIASNNSSIPEIVGNSVLLIDPRDPKKIAEAILRVLNDNNLRRDLISKGYENIKRFSWEKCARETLDFIRK
jgi:glycosyltransferase involved in cell wall biosynthesis